MNSMICPYCGNLIAYNSYFDAFYCPKCGGFFKQATVVECNDLNEPLTLDDAIAHLDDTLSDTGHKWSCESCRMEHVQLRAWLAELREIKQNRNEPLTLDELRSAYKFGYPVWLVGMEDGDGWVFIHYVDSCSVRYARIGTSEEWCFRTKSYGVRVWAYRQKPEEESHQ